MSAKTNDAKIGVFVLGAVALFVAGLLAFGAKSLFMPKVRGETAVQGDVAGLSIGSRVELRGVPVGKVSAIEFEWSAYPGSTNGNIIVEFEIEQAIIPREPGLELKDILKRAVDKGLRAVVKGQGVTGTSILALDYLDPAQYPPPPIAYSPRYYYIPSAPSQFSRLLESIEDSLREIRNIDFRAVGGGITNALAGVHDLMKKLDEIHFSSIGTNADSLLTELHGTVADIRKTIDGLRLDNTSRNASELIDGLRETNVKLQAVLDKADAAPLSETVADLREAAQSLHEVLLQLKRYPSGFIFGEPPPPAKSVQAPSK